MAGESTEELLRKLTAAAGEDAPEVYGTWAGLLVTDGGLEQIVRRKLVAAGHSVNLRESLEASIRAGGGVGESTEQMLLKTGLVGLS